MRPLTTLLTAVFTGSLLACQAWATPAREADLQREKHIAVHFDLAPGWKRDRNMMDSIWQRPLGLRGVNDYAFGAAVAPKTFAARSDPSSPLYQAWFGVYTVGGGKAKFASGKAEADLHSAIALMELDQRSWLDSIGDPKPLATSHAKLTKSVLMIDGAHRTVYHFDMDSHSDLNVPHTDLARYMGMPPAAQWKQEVSALHDVLLHIDCAFWYGAAQDVTFVVYGASAAFRDNRGTLHDNAAIEPALKRMMESVKIGRT